MTTAAVPTACPQCGGDLWDNRADNAKKSDGRRRPDFRCKEDREHVIWPPSEKKNGQRTGGGKQGYSSGAPLPGEETPAAVTPEEQGAKLRKLMALHTAITTHVVTKESPLFLDAKVGDSPEAASTRINTLFIAATAAGLHR